LWNDFQLLATIFVAKNKAGNYNELVENLLLSYYELSCILSLKILFLNYHQDIFPETCGTLSSEHGECFHYKLAIEKTSGQMEFTDVGGILLDSNKILLDLFKNGR